MTKIRITLIVGTILCFIGCALRTHAQEAKIIEVTDELPCDANTTVFIGNTIRRVTVLTTHENKVRLVTTVSIEGKCVYTNEEWLKILELKVSGTAMNVGVKSGNMQPVDDWDTRFPRAGPLPDPPSPTVSPISRRDAPPNNNLTPNGTVVFDDKGNWLYKTSNIRRNIFLYVPVGAKLNIDSRYAEIILDSNIKEVDARITNGSMTTKDVDRLVLNSSAGSIYAANIRQADVQLNHGWFHAKDIAALEITSKSSTIELGTLGQLKINSNDDQYEIESAEVITREKNYASIRVNTLIRSLDLVGINADIRSTT